MHYEDLYEFPDGHPPSPYDIPASIVKVGDGYLPAGLKLRAVGWLDGQDFSQGPVSAECIQALADAYPRTLISDGYRGIHACSECDRSDVRVRISGRTIRLVGHGHYLVKMGNIVYMAPALLLHYIRAHKYQPPKEFTDACIAGQFLTEDDLDIRWKEYH